MVPSADNANRVHSQSNAKRAVCAPNHTHHVSMADSEPSPSGFLPGPPAIRDALAVVGAVALAGGAVAAGASAWHAFHSIGRPTRTSSSREASSNVPFSIGDRDQSRLGRARAASEIPVSARSEPAPHVSPGEESPLVRARQERGDTKRIRIYVDGCFDMMHYGHR